MLRAALHSVLVLLALQSVISSSNPFAHDRIAKIELFKRRAPALVSRFEKRVYKDQHGDEMPYRLFRPERTVKGRKYPLVLFLHGAAGSGTDNEKQLEGANMFGGLVWALPENQKRFPAFVVAPQSNINWPAAKIEPGKRPVLLPGLGLGSRLALEIVEQLVLEFPIDSTRIYVTGHSMGGAGTFNLIAYRPGFFAAAVPVCGLPDFSMARAMTQTPTWNFHGDKDDIEPVATSRRIIREIRKAGGKPRYTEYPGVGHNSFLWAYTEPGLLKWLFAQRRVTPRPTSESAQVAARYGRPPGSSTFSHPPKPAN